MKSCAVIGAGVAGIASSIRLANKGYKVTVFEANDFPGGKLSQSIEKGYRFDMGPSVFTMPRFVDELFELSGKNPRDYFEYIPLDPGYRYFYEDGTRIKAHRAVEEFAEEIAKNTTEKKETILKYLQKVKRKYDLTAEVFLYNSLHRWKHYFSKAVWRGLLNFGALEAFKTMDESNQKTFKDPRVSQLFNRYATYNGSDPYQAPATLNVIPHLEINLGAYFPKKGMYDITQTLLNLAKDLGVEFEFNSRVTEILIEHKKIKGVKANGEDRYFDIVVSNMDVYSTYHKLIPSIKKPTTTLNQPKSSSALIFYWGIRHDFKELGLHNIFFSKDYPKEFNTIFLEKSIAEDPTIYINITSKECATDAPEGCENWFTMINVPNNSGQDWEELIAKTRENMIVKINRILKTDIRPMIECELILDPRGIEARTSSAFGSIYGNSSNNKFAAFLRHANFSSKVKNLYFAGGSVHPGPSIPLCLLSAKIMSGFVEDAHQK